jgi:hypothetical protein
MQLQNKTLLEKAKQIESLAGKLGLIIPIPYLHIEHKDKNGRLYPNGDYYNVAQSWVRNAYNFMLCRISGCYAYGASPNYGTGYLNAKNPDGTIIGGSSYNHTYGDGTGGDNCDNYNIETTDPRGYFKNNSGGYNESGIQVGIGTNAESFEDYTLQTLIVYGSTAGKLLYGIMSVAESDNGLIHKASWGRTITHNGNGQPSVVVAEVSLVTRMFINNADFTAVFLRDILSAPVTMVYLDTLDITYEITLTYPS